MVKNFLEGLRDTFLTILSNEKMMPSFLVMAITAGFLLVTILLFFRIIPTESKDVATLILGALTAKFGDVVAYHFNSSAGSAKKTEMMAKVDK